MKKHFLVIKGMLLSFVISDVWAQEASTQQGDTLVGFLPLIILFIVFYFILIRPQSKRAKEHKKMVEALAKGDEVVTNGGLLGKLTEVGDSFLVMEIADNVQVKVQRGSVSSVIPKGTIKSL